MLLPEPLAPTMPIRLKPRTEKATSQSASQSGYENPTPDSSRTAPSLHVGTSPPRPGIPHPAAPSTVARQAPSPSFADATIPCMDASAFFPSSEAW